MKDIDSERRSVIPLVAIFGTIAILAFAWLSDYIDFAAAANTVSNSLQSIADSAGQAMEEIFRAPRVPHEQPFNP